MEGVLFVSPYRKRENYFAVYHDYIIIQIARAPAANIDRLGDSGRLHA
jgi:hypothetical protein